MIHGDLYATVRQRLCAQARRDACEFEDVDCPLLQHAGAYAAEDVLGVAARGSRHRRLPDEGAAEHQARGSRADDDDLGAHVGHAGRRAADWRWRNERLLDFSGDRLPAERSMGATSGMASSSDATRCPSISCMARPARTSTSASCTSSRSPRAAACMMAIRPHAHRDLHHLLLVQRGGGVYSAEVNRHEFAPVSLISVPLSCVHGSISSRAPTVDRDRVRRAVATNRSRHRGLEWCSTAERHAAPLRRPRRWQPSNRCGRVSRSPARPAHRGGVWLTAISSSVASSSSLHRRYTHSLTRFAVAVRYRALIEASYRTQMSIADYAHTLLREHRALATCLRTQHRQRTAPRCSTHADFSKRSGSLLYTNMSVTLVAETCGFADPAYFSRFFARSTARRPRLCRA